MKKNIILFATFILIMACFLGLRLYAGKENSAVSTSDSSKSEASVSDSIDDSSNEADSAITIVSDNNLTSANPEQGLLNNEWHDDFVPTHKFSGPLPRIICWGDSLTESTDNKSAYPDVLREISGCEVINYGVSSESTSMIAMREGGIAITVDATVIPAACETIPVFLHTDTGGSVLLEYHGDKAVNPCRIGNIEGVLQRINGAYYFTRLTAGERTPIEEGTPLHTFGFADSRPDDVLIIFTGTNDKPDRKSIYDVIAIQQKMISAVHCDKYIVVGLTYSEDYNELQYVNEILSNEYEEHFLDIRTYLLNYGIEDAGLTASSQDISDISSGIIPASLRSDSIHGNKYYYKLLAEQIYRRLQYLGYLPI